MGFEPAVELEPTLELERVAALARRQMWESAAPEAIEEWGIEVRRFGPLEATVVGGEPQERRLNEIRGAIEPGHLADAVEWMRAWEVEYRIVVPERDRGAGEAEAWLEARSYERCGGRVVFARDTTAPLPAAEAFDGEVFELTEEWEGESFSMLAREALDLPSIAEQLAIMLPSKDNWRCYTALLGDENLIAATGATMIERDVALLALDTTLSRARGRGCHRALLRRRLADAAEAGCRLVFAELDEEDPVSFEAARRNLLEFGFEQTSRSSCWQRPALARMAA